MEARQPRKYGDSLTLPRVAALAGVEYRTLHIWLRRGLLRPSRQAADGSGSLNLLDEHDAFVARVLGDLRRAGMEMRVLKRVARALEDSRGKDFQSQFLIVNGKVTFVAKDRDLAGLLDGAGASIVYDLAAARPTESNVIHSVRSGP